MISVIFIVGQVFGWWHLSWWFLVITLLADN